MSEYFNVFFSFFQFPFPNWFTGGVVAFSVFLFLMFLFNWRPKL